MSNQDILPEDITTENEEPQPTWDMLMKSAYEKWPENVGYSDFLNVLTEVEKHAVMLGNLNAQVCNGGFSQWITNGYCVCINDLMDVLTEIGTEKAIKIREMLESFAEHINTRASDNGCFGSYIIEPEDNSRYGRRRGNGWYYDDDDDEEEEEEESYEEQILEEVSQLDEGYYDIYEDFEMECEEYLKGKMNK